MLLSALKSHPVVFLNGPRQTGKSTLVRHLQKNDYPADYVSFDNATQMAAAEASPESFLGQFKSSAIIDEVQMVPSLFRTLKLEIDELRLSKRKRKNGRFLLTGSANIMSLPQLSDALVGRMSVKTLYPFATCEALAGEGDFLQRLFVADFADIKKHFSLHEVIRKATFPEISGKAEKECDEWLENYIMTLLQRDVRALVELEKIGLLPTMLRILATRAGCLINDADIARGVGLNPVTSKSYRSILQTMFLSFDIRPWYRNIGKRLLKSSKGYLIDTRLLCHLLGSNSKELEKKRMDLYGCVVENFVATELLKLLSFSGTRIRLLHFRTSDNKEVDFVLERSDGALVGLEVKTSHRVTGSDFKGIKALQDAAKKDFLQGVVLYGGQDVIPFGHNLHAVPLSALWL